ncbi:hypothetical protein PROFUN_11075 [Planoprotostelium fungivorum]|uniref:HECT-type E3 ubiquitin transferase n=1 Tax=Planoprotostelium fungivorum TaxID=1890364 RepID=A0A2P6NAI5_9EUKA|nr:hypothetical protein PROFUN_11075 [Planoprotostelium fungivorum]
MFLASQIEGGSGGLIQRDWPTAQGPITGVTRPDKAEFAAWAIKRHFHTEEEGIQMKESPTLTIILAAQDGCQDNHNSITSAFDICVVTQHGDLFANMCAPLVTTLRVGTYEYTPLSDVSAPRETKTGIILLAMAVILVSVLSVQIKLSLFACSCSDVPHEIFGCSSKLQGKFRQQDENFILTEPHRRAGLDPTYKLYWINTSLHCINTASFQMINNMMDDPMDIDPPVTHVEPPMTHLGPFVAIPSQLASLNQMIPSLYAPVAPSHPPVVQTNTLFLFPLHSTPSNHVVPNMVAPVTPAVPSAPAGSRVSAAVIPVVRAQRQTAFNSPPSQPTQSSHHRSSRRAQPQTQPQRREDPPSVFRPRTITRPEPILHVQMRCADDDTTMGLTEPLPDRLKRMRELHNPRAIDRSDSSHFGIPLTLPVPFRVTMKGSSYKTFMLAVNQWSHQIERGLALDNLTVDYFDEDHVRRGVDGGGLTTEYFNRLGEIMYGNIFVAESETADNWWFTTNEVDEKTLLVVGAVMAKALLDKVKMPLSLCPIIYKLICGESLVWKDLQVVKPDLYKNMTTEVGRQVYIEDEYTFSPIIDSLQYADNLPHWKLNTTRNKDLLVTSDTFEEWMLLQAEFVMVTSVKKNILGFLRGFYSIIPLQYVRDNFTPQELQRELEAVKMMSYDDFLDRVQYRPSNRKRIFNEAVRGLTPNQVHQLLFFITGMNRLPGSSRSILILETSTMRTELLPQAHTCSLSMDVPIYPDAQTMRTKIIIALENSNGSYGIA